MIERYLDEPRFRARLFFCPDDIQKPDINPKAIAFSNILRSYSYVADLYNRFNLCWDNADGRG